METGEYTVEKVQCSHFTDWWRHNCVTLTLQCSLHPVGLIITQCNGIWDCEYVELWWQDFDRNLRESKRFSAQRLVKEYPNKMKRQTLDDFLCSWSSFTCGRNMVREWTTGARPSKLFYLWTKLHPQWILPCEVRIDPLPGRRSYTCWPNLDLVCYWPAYT